MASSRLRRLDYASLLIAICVFLVLKPWFVWNTSSYFQFGVIPVLYLLAIVPNIDIKGVKSRLFLIFFALLLFVVIIQRYNLAYSLSVLSLCVVPFIKEEKFHKALQYFEIILAVFFAGGLVFYILLLIGVPLPGRQITALNFVEFDMGYIVYPPFMVRRNMAVEYLRFYGPFDEPGVVGTVSLFVLCIEKYNLKKRPVLIIFIAALFSLSFMFVAGSLVYFSFKYIKKPSRAILAVLLLLSFYAVTKNIPVFKTAIYGRMEWDADAGKLSGDNRYGNKQYYYVKSIRWTNDYLWGNHGKTEGEFGFSRSYLDAILSYGFVFCFLYVIWFLYYSRIEKPSWYAILFFLLILLLNLYQRPNFLHYSYIFLYSAFARVLRIEMVEDVDNKQITS